MKFGKRYSGYIESRQPERHFSYAAFKQALQSDLQSFNDPPAWSCDASLRAELQTFSSHVDAKTLAFEVALEQLIQTGASEEAAYKLAQDIKDVLNQGQLTCVAVVKAAKKRNRHLAESFGAESIRPLQALELLGNEAFFSSPRLAQLSTRAEVIAQQAAQQAEQASGKDSKTDASQLLSSWECPICLEALHQPVVLTCAHRFCRSCAVNHAGHCNDHVAQQQQQLGSQNGSKGQTETPSSDGASKGARGQAQQQQQAQALPPWALGTFQMMEEDIQDVDSSRVAGEQEYFACPVCRKAQVLDLSAMQVDAALHAHIMELRRLSGIKAPKEASWGLLPPQAPQHEGKLTVLLDMDGTLITSFPPKRAPRVPPGMTTHIVGIGSKLNPMGVFVVERPQLKEFLRSVAQFAEVVVYTAGFEDYAKPIIDAIDPTREFITHTLYRDSTLATEHYQCVKDMNRLSRPIERVVLVDDTPLAFLHQPDNGIPMLAYRGGSEDKLLLEAVLPLLKDLSIAEDVQPVLRKRFGMTPWFKRRGLPIEAIKQRSALAAQLERERHTSSGFLKAQRQPSAPAASLKPQPSSPLPQQPSPAVSAVPGSGPATQEVKQAGSGRPYLFVTDFDKTLVDFDAGERVIEELAPELLPMLMGLESPANFIPVTNELLGELQRRGVSRDQLLQCLKGLGADLPAPTLGLMRTLEQYGVEARILSDCNSVFISHILAGANAPSCFVEVLTNPSSFEYVPVSQSFEGGGGSEVSSIPLSLGSSSSSSSSSRSNSTSSDGSSDSMSSSSDGSSDGCTKLPVSSSLRSTVGGKRTSGRGSSNKSSSDDSSRDGSSSSQNWFMKGISKLTQHKSTPPSLSKPLLSEAAAAVPCGVPSMKLVIKAHQEEPHGCGRCPSNLCKGTKVRALKASGCGPIIYAGDGSNDICACDALSAGDVILARENHPLGRWATTVAASKQQQQVTVRVWKNHEELEAMVRDLVGHCT